MPYVQRNEQGDIICHYANKQIGFAEEFLPNDSEELKPTLAEIKELKWLEIKVERDRRKSGGVLVSGKWFHSDSESRIQQLALTVMGASVPPIEWKTMDGSFTQLSQSLVGQIFQALASADIANFANAESHRIAMEASADPSIYDYSTGWTPIYGE